MSATNRGATRKDSDYYPTPADAINKFLEAHSLKDGAILECAAGNGSIVKAIKGQNRYDIDAVELREEEKSNLDPIAENVYIQDFLTWQPDREYSTIITNPPFSIAREIIEHCFKIAGAETEIIMLLRLAFLESRKRKDFWDKHKPDQLYVLSERPSFTGKGTDATAYGWFIWNSNKKGIEII